MEELGPNFRIWAHWPKIRKICINSVLLTFQCSMRPSRKCLIVSKTLVRTKLKFHPFWRNWGLISIFGPIGAKSKNPHKFSSLNLLMYSETILEMPYCQLNFGKNRPGILPFWGALGPDFHIWVHWPKIKKGQ